MSSACAEEEAVPAPEPFLRPNDVIAFVGGEDMVAASEYGYLELLLTRALPDYKLRFRCLAWEGDTVFEQRRDLNYPTLEQQLDRIGATVVICQFGQMESLMPGKEMDKLPVFIAAYGSLMTRLEGTGKRRVVVLTPFPFEDGHARKGTPLYESGGYLRSIVLATKQMARPRGARIADLYWDNALLDLTQRPQRCTSDGTHLSSRGHWIAARAIERAITDNTETYMGLFEKARLSTDDGTFLKLVAAKNRLWFQYSRPQNWAFLAGDRTNQPSSRDHLDPSKRWFPAELEQFVPMIKAKERAIDALAAELSRP